MCSLIYFDIYVWTSILDFLCTNVLEIWAYKRILNSDHMIIFLNCRLFIDLESEFIITMYMTYFCDFHILLNILGTTFLYTIFLTYFLNKKIYYYFHRKIMHDLYKPYMVIKMRNFIIIAALQNVLKFFSWDGNSNF